MHIIECQTKLRTFCSVIVAKGSALAHLVKLSTTIMINLHWPLPIGKGPNMSSPHC